MLPKLLNYELANSLNWQGRTDSLPGERFFQQTQLHDVRTQSYPAIASSIALLGFMSDEGIRRNLGRVGAKAGPNALRTELGKLPCHRKLRLLDCGNIICHKEELELAQEQLAILVQYCHQQGSKTLLFGGGHEITWGHFLGLKNLYPNIGIINFDAHFDLRPLNQNRQSTSGTSFWQIAQDCQKNNRPFSYFCAGIQPHANSESLFITADRLNVTYLTTEQIQANNLAWQLSQLERFIQANDFIYLTICLDVFAESYAPGVSAPQALGLTPWHALPMLKYIVQTGKVISIDIAELSPMLDHDHKTARLGAMLVAELLEIY